MKALEHRTRTNPATIVGGVRTAAGHSAATLGAVFRRTFGMLRPGYLFRGWFIGGVFSLPFLLMQAPAMVAVVFVLNAVLMPFSKFVWDSTKTLVLGSSVIFVDLRALYLGKLLVNFLLWVFALLVAPVGMLLLVIRSYVPEPDHAA